MKIELKNIHISARSEKRYTAFAADLFINDEHIAVIKNNGDGLIHSIYTISEQARQVILDIEQLGVSAPNDSNASHKFHTHLSEIIEKHKVHFELQKAMKGAILFGLPGTEKLNYHKLKIPIDDLLKSEAGIKILKKELEMVIKNMKKGEVILNTNIPESLKVNI